MREPRTPVMTMVEASWEDKDGVLQTAPACMEVRSTGGACIRLKTPIDVGSKLSVEWRFEQFSGVARNCRQEGKDYLVGIQRDKVYSPPQRPSPPREPAPPLAQETLMHRSLKPPTPAPGMPPRLPPREMPRATISAATRAEMRLPPKRWPVERSEPEAAPKQPPVPRFGDGGFLTARPGNVGAEKAEPEKAEPQKSEPGAAQAETVNVVKATEPQLPQQVRSGEVEAKERTTMKQKWLEMASWRKKQESAGAGAEASDGKKAREETMAPVPPIEEFVKNPAKAVESNAPAHARAQDDATFQVELVPMEDIYRAAGIMTPRKGYTVKKVVEMLNSEHIHALSKEMKRVAVLMALDAAGVPLDEILQDARARQQALDAHEAEQKKRVEAEWARKEEENAQIQEEMERLKAHHMARINRNLEAITREKATFASWQAMKLQETQSIAEAAEMCAKQPAAAPAATGSAETSKDAPKTDAAKASEQAGVPVAELTMAKAASAKMM